MADLWMALVVTSFIFGISGYVYARRTGQNPALWAALGVLLNVMALAFLLRRRARRRG